MSKYRVAVIGTGGIARHHGNYYAAHPQTEVVAGSDISPEALDAYCEQFSVPATYANYRELLASEKPDIVSVCTWQDTHPEITIAAAEAGAKGVLCEKPMGVDLAGPEAAVRTCEERGVKLVVHHQTRFGPPFVAARKAIAEGMIGEPLVFLARCQAGLLNIGSHVIDIARYVFGDPTCLWVIGQAQRIPAIAARSQQSISIKWHKVWAGVTYVGITVDAEGRHRESDEQNNQIYRLIVVGEHQTYMPFSFRGQ